MELGFTLLFIIKKWYEDKTALDCNDALIHRRIAVLMKRLEDLKDNVLQSYEEDLMVSGATTFFKDLILGFVYIGKSNIANVIMGIEAVTKQVFTEEEFKSVCNHESFKQQALNFFNKYTGSIEIVRSDKTETVYFPILPYAEALYAEQKGEWLQELPIGKPRAKLDYFMDNSLDYLQQLKNEYLFARIFRYYPVFGALAKQIPLWKSTAFYLVSTASLTPLVHHTQYLNHVLLPKAWAGLDRPS